MNDLELALPERRMFRPNRYGVRVNPLNVALAANAAALVPRAYNQVSNLFSKRTRAPYFQSNAPQKRSKRANSMLKYQPQGDRSGSRTYKVKKNRKRKRSKSLKRKVSKMSKKLSQLPPVSTSKYSVLENTFIQSAIVDRKMLLQYPVYNHKHHEDAIKKIPSGTGDVDYGGAGFTQKPAIRFNSRFFKLRLKNFSNVAATIKYQFVVCIDDDKDSPIASIVQYASKRNNGFTNSIVTQSDASATANFQPEHLHILMDESEYANKIFGVYASKYKAMTPVQTITIGPSDNIVISQKLKNGTYRPEKFDNEPLANMQGDVYLIMTVLADLVKCSNTSTPAPNLLHFSETSVGGTIFRSGNYVVQNGAGAKEFNAISTFDDTNRGDLEVITENDPTREAMDES